MMASSSMTRMSPRRSDALALIAPFHRGLIACNLQARHNSITGVTALRLRPYTFAAMTNSQATMSNPSHASPLAALPHVLVVDDYLTKPFSPRELLARIRTVLRRRRSEVRQGKPEGVRAYRFDGWELNLNTRRLTSREGRSVPLSNGEFSLLVVLLGAPNRILSRDQLLDLSRLHNDEVYNGSVDVQIMRLRRKIEKDAAEPR